MGKAYARTKLYNILFTRELARRLAGAGVTANALHPGVVATNIGRDGDVTGLRGTIWPLIQRFRKPPEAGTDVTVFVATAPEFATATGQYIGANLRAVQPSRLARDDAAARRLWNLSSELVGLTAAPARSALLT